MMVSRSGVIDAAAPVQAIVGWASLSHTPLQLPVTYFTAPEESRGQEHVVIKLLLTI